MYEAEIEARPEKKGQSPKTKTENNPSEITGYLAVHAELAECFYGPEGKNTLRKLIATLGSEGREMIESQKDENMSYGKADVTTLTTIFKRSIGDEQPQSIIGSKFGYPRTAT